MFGRSLEAASKGWQTSNKSSPTFSEGPRIWWGKTSLAEYARWSAEEGSIIVGFVGLLAKGNRFKPWRKRPAGRGLWE